MADADAALEQQILYNLQEQRNRTYISTTSRITSGEELNRRNGLRGRALDLPGISSR